MPILSYLPAILALVFPACLIWAAISDITTMTIPNRLTLGLAALFVPVALMCQLSLQQWGIHLGIGIGGLVFGMGLFAFRFLGGGDAKLIAAAALWLGLDGSLALLVYTAIVGGALSLGLIGARRFFWVYASKLPPWLAQHLEPKADIPYGIAICIGGLLAIPHCDLFTLLTRL